MFEWLQIFPKTNTVYQLVVSTAGLEFEAQTIAMEKAIDMIANTISKCEFRHYAIEGGKVKEKFDEEYYTLNVRPNPNDDGTAFWKRVTKKSFQDYETGALVVIHNNGLYLADSFEVNDKVLVSKTYSNVTIGNYKLNKTFSADDVILVKQNNDEIAKLMQKYYANMDTMISYALNDYRQKNGMKIIAKMPGKWKVKKENEDVEIDAQTYLNTTLRGLFEGDNVGIPVDKSIELQILGEKIPNKDSTDFRNLIRHVFEDVATAFHIPRDVFFGTKTEKSTSMTDFLTFAVDNPIQVLEDALNGHMIEKEKYIKGERIVIDKLRIQHFDVIDSAVAMDKYFAIGFSHNEIRRWLSMPRVEEDWADEHHVTKNYSESTKGGEK
ncbi:MAG: hypothetical protein CVU90_15205 [Firmicutes bacterium HGW-Firmicutes-15]|jgi:HK97 family phage portal protein|nr:MAG: hypothetical protein CVU90_15205 [Firmicutes bacterium HGW-Firmicutes-15]